jgi:hypothetical protein
MDHNSALAALLHAFRRRILVLFFERWVCWGIAGAGVAALILLVVDLCSVFYVTPFLLAIVAVVGGLVGAGIAWFRRPDMLSIALTVERRCALKERASTAVALLADPQASPEFAALITDDAVAHLQARDPRDLFPRTFARPYRAALAVWAAVGLACLLPSIPWFYGPDARAERAAMHDAGVALREVVKKIEAHDRVRRDPEAQKLVRRMKKLATEMEKHRLPKKESLKRMNKLRDEAERLRQRMAKEDAEQTAKALAAASAQMSAAMHGRSEAEKAAAQRAKERLAAGLSRQQLTKEERDALDRQDAMQQLQHALQTGNMSSAMDALRRLGVPTKNGAMSKATRDALSQAMREMAKAAKQNGNTSASQAMNNAANQLQQGTQQGQQQAGDTMANMPGGKGTDAGEMLRQAMQNLDNMRQSVGANQPGGGKNGKGGKGDKGSGNGKNGKGGGGGSGGGGKQGGGNGGKLHGNGKQGQNHGSDRDPNADPNPNWYGTHEGDPAYAAGGGRESLNHGLSHGYAAGERPMPAGAPGAMTVDVRGGEGGGHTSVPYADVYSDYRKSAERAIEAEEVPPSYTTRVKEYFDSLDPSRR